MTFRYDIQFLRGFAVFIILLFHAKIGPFQGGYLGVDIFFVISGFLITTLVVKHLQESDFSFKTFYYRRAKRLLPAAYVTLLGTAIASYFFLSESNFSDYQNQLFGALTFTTNFALADQSGNFDSASEMKPLLHMWSLAIEEQFYLILPLALFFFHSRYWKLGVILGVIISLAGCFLLIEKYPEKTFYYLPTRAWELGFGCFGALYANNKTFKLLSKKLIIPAFLALLLLPIFPLSDIHPSIDALLVCMATLLIIQSRPRVLDKNFFTQPLIRMGNYSYSLYLVHWPIFAFAANGYMGDEIPLEVRSALLALSFLLAVALFHIVENPIHRAKSISPRLISAPLFIIPVMLISGSMLIQSSYANNYSELLRRNVGLAEECASVKDYSPKISCQTSESPDVLVWGDSHAMHLVEGISNNAKAGVIQATKSSCSPLQNLSFFLNPKYSSEWAKSCIAFNEAVLTAMPALSSVDIVIIAASFGKITEDGIAVLKKNQNEYKAIEGGVKTSASSLAETVKAIRSLGKKVVIVSSPPISPYNVGECLERLNTNKLLFGPKRDCSVTIDNSRGLAKNVYDFLETAAAQADVDVIYLSDYLCQDNICKTSINGKWIYRDGGHLSYEGSEEAFNEYRIMSDIYDRAR